MRTSLYRDPRGRFCCTECGATEDLCQCVNPDETAHRRLWSKEGRTLTLLAQEVEKKRDQLTTPHLLAHLAEALGAVHTKFLEHDAAGSFRTDIQRPTAEEVYRALLVLCAIGVELAIHGDGDYSYESDAIFGEN